MLMRYIPTIVSAIVLLGTVLGSPQRAAAQSLYDKPLEVRHVKLKPDPDNPQQKREVSCFTYPHFVLKQVDFGEVGAERLSVIAGTPGKTTPCREEKEQDEYVIPVDVWSGYFDGVKSGYAVFSSPDGINGGLGFMVFRLSDKKKLFEDTAQKGLQSLEIKDAMLKIRYQRVFASSCSVITGGQACHDTVVKQAGLAGGSLSSCAHGYTASKEEMAKMRCDDEAKKDAACFDRELKRLDEQKWDDTPTVVVYEAEAALGDAAPVIKPLGNVLICRPSD